MLLSWFCSSRFWRRSLRSELENGRLAMIGFALQIMYELVTGNTIGTIFEPLKQLNQVDIQVDI